MKDLQKEKIFSKQGDLFSESSTQQQHAEHVNPLLENVIVEVEEKVSCSLNKDGDLDKFEIKGIIYLTLNDPKKSNPIIQVGYQNIKGFTFKPHPEMDKQNWNKGKILCAADQSTGLPPQTRIDAVRYRYTSKDDADLPFTLNVFNSKK